MASVEWYAGNRIRPIKGFEGTGQTFHAGDLVDLDTSGNVIIATAGNIQGIARQHATGTNGSLIDWEPIACDGIYVASYHTDETAQALIGDCLDFTFTVGAHTLDEDSATTDCYCVGLRDPAGTASGRLLIRFPYTLFTWPAD